MSERVIKIILTSTPEDPREAMRVFPPRNMSLVEKTALLAWATAWTAGDLHDQVEPEVIPGE